MQKRSNKRDRNDLNQIMTPESISTKNPSFGVCQLRNQNFISGDKIDYVSPSQEWRRKIGQKRFINNFTINSKLQEKRDPPKKFMQTRDAPYIKKGVLDKEFASLKSQFKFVQLHDNLPQITLALKWANGIYNQQTDFPLLYVKIADNCNPKLTIGNVMEIFKLYKTKLTVDNQEDLYRYFKENKDKTNGLIDITHKIIILKEKYFGDNTQSQLFLQINDDPENQRRVFKILHSIKTISKGHDGTDL